jgi:hypothetical protein
MFKWNFGKNPFNWSFMELPIEPIFQKVEKILPHQNMVLIKYSHVSRKMERIPFFGVKLTPKKRFKKLGSNWPQLFYPVFIPFLSCICFIRVINNMNSVNRNLVRKKIPWRYPGWKPQRLYKSEKRRVFGWNTVNFHAVPVRKKTGSRKIWL